MFIQANIDAVLKHPTPYELAKACSALQDDGIFSPRNRELIAAHLDPISLSEAFSHLHHAGILTDANCAHVANGDDFGTEYLASTFLSLRDAGLLTQANLNVLITTEWDYSSWTKVLTGLAGVGILTQINFDKIVTLPDLDALDDVLICIDNSLTQDILDRLLQPNHAALRTEDALDHIWFRIAAHFYTAENFARLFTAAESLDPMQALLAVKDDILGVGAEVVAAPGSQMVYRSVSSSAEKLWHNYHNQFVLEDKIQEIKDAVALLDDSFKHQVVRRCMLRISDPLYVFTDPSSKVSTRQLLALSYHALHDATKRKDDAGIEVSLADAKALFFDGLYEIQRGYNLNTEGVDDQLDDKFICLAGTFNKLMAKLNGIHQDVAVYFITHEGARNKLPKLVQQHALQYLSSIVSATDVADYLRILDWLTRLEAERSIVPIWPRIVDRVQAELWSEFGEAYSHVVEDARFTTLMASGQKVTLPDITEIKRKLLASSGSQRYIEEQARSHHGMFVPKDDDETPNHKRMRIT